MEPLGIVGVGCACCGAVQLAAWWRQTRTRNATAVDAVWALSVGALAVGYGLAGSGHPARRLAAAVLGLVWALRLGGHLIRERVLKPHEDGRYAELRARWGDRAPGRFLVIYLLQATWSTLFSLPFLALSFDPRPPGGWTDLVGLVIYLVAIVGETIADGQLARFRKDPATRGTVCDQGLWAWSRHPNYFFEWCHWFAYPFLAWRSPLVLLAIMGPAVVAAFLFRLTGIPHTEAQALRSRGEAYRRYQARTSVFIPWFPGGERS